MKKGMLSRVLALVIVLGMLTGCGSSSGDSSAADDSSTTDTVLAALDAAAREDVVSYLTDEAMKSDDVAMTVNGEEVSAGFYLYWVAYVMTSLESSGLTADMLDSQLMGDQTVSEYLLDVGKSYSTYYYVMEQMAAEEGLTLDDSEEEETQSYVDSLDAAMLLYYASSAEVQETVYRQYLLGSKLQETLYGEGGELEPTEEDIEAYAEESYYTCRYILFPLTDGDGNELDSDEQLENCKAVYEELQEVSAEDLEETFQQYQEEYNTTENGADGNTDRYTFSSGTVVSGFEDTTSELGENELGMTEEATSYGYFIILRLPLEVDDDLLSEMESDYISEMFNSVIQESIDGAEVALSDEMENLDVTAFCTNLMDFQSEILAAESAAAETADSSS